MEALDWAFNLWSATAFFHPNGISFRNKLIKIAMTEKNSEKAKLIFIEAKERLQFSNLDSERLDQKISRFSSICVASIGSLTAVLSFLKDGNIFFKLGLFVLIVGFIYSLFKAFKAQQAKKYASNGIEASVLINDEIIGRNDEIYLMECLALTYEEKANFNNKLIDDNAILFNKALKKLRFFFFTSLLFMVLGFFSPEILLSLVSKIMVLAYHAW